MFPPGPSHRTGHTQLSCALEPAVVGWHWGTWGYLGQWGAVLVPLGKGGAWPRALPGLPAASGCRPAAPQAK